MIGPILKSHRSKILRINDKFVHWLWPMDDDDLDYILARAHYQRQINDGAGVLLGYGHDVDYPDQWNMNWLKAYYASIQDRADFFYIDRVIIAPEAQGQGLGRQLYDDVTQFAARHHYWRLCCEVNIKPNNPASHGFHLKMGFKPIGQAQYPHSETAVRYYEKCL